MKKTKFPMRKMVLCAMAIMSSLIPCSYAQNTEGALTPDGNMTLVDDIISTSEENKQFITVTSKNGNVFYIIIDRADDGENTVHFLNQVDESDLLALMGEEPVVEESTPICICKTACEAGDVNLNCPVCTLNYEKCMGEEVEEDEPEAEPVAVEKKSSPLPWLAAIVALGAGGAYVYLKKFKKAEAPSTEDEEWDEEMQVEEESEPAENVVG